MTKTLNPVVAAAAILHKGQRKIVNRVKIAVNLQSGKEKGLQAETGNGLRAETENSLLTGNLTTEGALGTVVHLMIR